MCFQIIKLKTWISNVERTARFWNNLHRVLSRSNKTTMKNRQLRI